MSISANPIGLIGGAVVAFLAYNVLSCLYIVFVHPLRNVPGPFWAKFSRIWLLRQYASGKHTEQNIALHDQLGPVVRIAPNQYSLNDPEATKTIYGHASTFKKADWYLPWGDPQWLNMFNVIDPKLHSMMRRKVASAYSMTALNTYEPWVEECGDLLCRQLSKAAENGATMNMFQWFRCYAFDVIGMITFSHRLGFLDHGKDEIGFMAALDEINPLSALMGVFPAIWPIFTTVGRIFSLKGPAGLQAMLKYVTDRITWVRANPGVIASSGPVDFIQKLATTTNEKSSGAPLTDEDIRGAAAANMLAGSDTTSITLTAMLYHILKNRVVYKKLQTEIDEAAAEGRLSDPVTFKEAQELSYLQAVIKEGLRVHPATGFTMPRVVPKGGATLAGQFFPENTVVGINSWVAHANVDVWGADARLFNPDRWLQPETKVPEAQFLSFGQGSRTCIGKNISLLEISKILTQIIRTFELRLEDGFEDLDVEVYWFTFPRSLPCVVSKR